MFGYEAELQETLRSEKRKQDSFNPQKYRYSMLFNHLVEENTYCCYCGVPLCRRCRQQTYVKQLCGDGIYEGSWVKVMSTPMYTYDEASDTFTITFSPGEAATGIELNEHILLRVNKAEQRAVGISIFDYSVLAQPTEFGLRSLPLTGLDDLSESTRELVLMILRSESVQSVLTMSAYAPTATETIPIAALQLPSPLLHAAY